MNFGIPQLIFVGLQLIGVGVDIANHGKNKTGQYNGWASFIGTCILFAILYWGGFFK